MARDFRFHVRVTLPDRFDGTQQDVNEAVAACLADSMFTIAASGEAFRIEGLLVMAESPRCEARWHAGLADVTGIPAGARCVLAPHDGNTQHQWKR